MARTITSRKARARGIRFTAQVWKEGSAYVAYSPELDISSAGDSSTQARVRLREAVTLFLEEAARQGTLGEILSESGFRKQGSTYRSHRILVRETIRLVVPVAV